MKRFALLLGLLCGCIALSAQTAQYPEGSLNPTYAVDSGAVNTLVGASAPCAAPVVGLSYRLTPAHANTTTTPTLAWCGTTAKTVTKYGTQAVAANDITTTAVAVFYYDGTYFELLNPQTSSSAGTVQDGAGTNTAGAAVVGTTSAHIVLQEPVS